MTENLKKEIVRTSDNAAEIVQEKFDHRKLVETSW